MTWTSEPWLAVGRGLLDLDDQSTHGLHTDGEAPARPLEDHWYVDANANDIPDFIETEIGADPTTDGCLPDRCQLPKGFSFDAVTKGQNTLLILDSSGSMAGPAGTKPGVDPKSVVPITFALAPARWSPW